jgi:hypothetical protein
MSLSLPYAAIAAIARAGNPGIGNKILDAAVVVKFSPDKWVIAGEPFVSSVHTDVIGNQDA